MSLGRVAGRGGGGGGGEGWALLKKKIIREDSTPGSTLTLYTILYPTRAHGMIVKNTFEGMVPILHTYRRVTISVFLNFNLTNPLRLFPCIALCILSAQNVKA